MKQISYLVVPIVASALAACASQAPAPSPMVGAIPASAPAAAASAAAPAAATGAPPSAAAAPQTSTKPAPTASTAPANAATAEAALAAAKTEVVVLGKHYKRVVIHDKEFFCMRQPITGSRVQFFDTCLTQAQIDATRDDSQRVLQDTERYGGMNQTPAICSGMTGRPGGC